MRTSMSSKANHLTWRDLRSDMRAPSRDAQPLEGRDRAFFSYLQGAAESSRTSITLACEHGHTRWKGSRCGPPFHLGDCSPNDGQFGSNPQPGPHLGDESG